jgi:AMMECR1 domain-containing protein
MWATSLPKKRPPWLVLAKVTVTLLLLMNAHAAFTRLQKLSAAEETNFTLTQEEKTYLLSVARRVLSEFEKVGEPLHLKFKDVPAALTQPEERFCLITIFPPQRPLIFAVAKKENLFNSTVEAAAHLAGSALALGCETEELETASIKIDISIKEDLVWPRSKENPPLPFELGVDGLYLEENGQEYFLPPGLAILKGISSEGDFVEELNYTYNLPPGQWDEEKTRLYKFRVLSFLQARPRREAVTLFRENVLVTEASPKAIKEALEVAAKRFLELQKEDGSFHFAFHPWAETFDDSHYGIVLHTEAALALLDLYKIKRDGAFLDAAQKALDFTKEHISPPGEDKLRYITWEGEVELGASALAAASFATHEDLSRKKRYHQEMLALGDFLLFMQEKDGSFKTYYEAAQNTPERPRAWDAPAQALLALVRIYKATEEEKFLQGARRAARFLIEDRETAWELTGPPPDAYLIMALEELYRLRPQKEYADYGLKMARCIIEEQYTEAGAPYPDYVGGFKGGAHPLTSQAAFRLTGLVGAKRLANLSGQPNEEIEKAIRRTVKFLLTQQYRQENSFYLTNPQASRGGFRAGPTDGIISLVALERAIRGLCGYLEVAE